MVVIAHEDCHSLRPQSPTAQPRKEEVIRGVSSETLRKFYQKCLNQNRDPLVAINGAQRFPSYGISPRKNHVLIGFGCKYSYLFLDKTPMVLVNQKCVLVRQEQDLGILT